MSCQIIPSRLIPGNHETSWTINSDLMTSFSKHPRHFCFPPQATPTEKLGHMLTYLGHTTSSNLGRMADLNEFHKGPFRYQKEA